ncbi:MAG: helix-turn-helix domain-containing protein [Hyphomicrobiaceae bacterium]
MGTLKIRKDRTPAVLRKLAKAETDARISRRLLAIANARSGMSRTEAARSAGMDRQTLRDWIIRYSEHGVAGLIDNWKGGRPPMLTLDEQAELLAIVMAGGVEDQVVDPQVDDLRDACPRNRHRSHASGQITPRRSTRTRLLPHR